MNGIINVLKPPGMTSHDVVYAVRRLTGVRRTGHTGTLDPGAAGVLPVCVGTATRVSEYVLGMDKAYRAELTLGSAIDTEDAAGAVITEETVPSLDEDTVARALKRFVGPGMQVPPMYSAVKIQGEKLYERARRGETVERPARPVHIYSIQLVRFSPAVLVFDLVCSRGTYVRTICREAAEMLGTAGHMSFLLRTAVGPYRLEEAVTLEELWHLRESGQLEQALLPLETALVHLSRVIVAAQDANRIQNGMAVQVPGSVDNGETVAVYGPNSAFLAVARTEEGYLRPQKVFK